MKEGVYNTMYCLTIYMQLWNFNVHFDMQYSALHHHLLLNFRVQNQFQRADSVEMKMRINKNVHVCADECG